MRTTLNIDDHLLTDARILAARTGRTLTAVIEDALREALSRDSGAQPEAAPFAFPTFAGTGPAPGVDLDDSASLLDQLESGLPLDSRR